jgi:hypothetical protein
VLPDVSGGAADFEAQTAAIKKMSMGAASQRDDVGHAVN